MEKITEKFTSLNQKQFINSMIMFTQAHRHNQIDRFLVELKQEVDNDKLLLQDKQDKRKIYADFDEVEEKFERARGGPSDHHGHSEEQSMQ